MDFYSLNKGSDGKGQKYDNVPDTSLNECGTPTIKLELNESQELHKEWINIVAGEDVDPELIDRPVKLGPYSEAINGENYMPSEGSISSKNRKQTKYKKAVLVMLFVCCLAVLAVAGAVFFGNSTHNKHTLVENFQDHSNTTIGEIDSSKDIPTSTIDSSIKHTKDMDITVTTSKSKTSERISTSSMSFLLTTLTITNGTTPNGKLKTSTSHTEETSRQSVSPSVSTKPIAATSVLSNSSGLFKTEYVSLQTSTAASESSPTSSITHSSVTTFKSESPSKRIFTSLSVPFTISTITRPFVTISQSNHPSERISLSSSATSSTITKQNQITTNIETVTTIGKQTTARNDTQFVSTTSSPKTVSSISMTKEQLSTSTAEAFNSRTQPKLTSDQTTRRGTTHPFVPTTIQVPLPDEQRTPKLIFTKPSSPITTSVPTYIKPLTEEQKTPDLISAPKPTPITKSSV